MTTTPPSPLPQRRGWELTRHLTTLARPSLLRRWYRHTFPLPTTFFDGVDRIAHRSISRIFGDWLKSEGSAREARMAYAAYRGGDVLDIGANNGFYSLLLAPKSHVGARHVVLEPEGVHYPKLLGHLAETKRLFPGVDFYPLPLAAGNGMVNQDIGFTFADAKIPRPADDLVAFFGLKVDFIKIDVEGYEWDVLQGLVRTLKEQSPVIMLEIHPDYLPAPIKAETIQQWLNDLGYISTEVDRWKWSWRQLWQKV